MEVGYGEAPTFAAYWVLDGDATFAFAERFAATTDGASWPGQLVVTHGPLGGLASGEIDLLGERLSFASCWGPDGTGIWQGGEDPRIVSVGDPQWCPAP